MTDFYPAYDISDDTGNPGLHTALIDARDGLPPNYHTDLITFLHDLIETRGFPQHLAVIFNALRYGYDLSAGGYHLPLLTSRVFTAQLWPDNTNAAPPIGAFAHLMTAKYLTYIPCEIVYKEGRHPAATAWAVEDDVDDTTVTITADGHVEVREALVLDYRTFVGHDTQDVLGRTIDRIRHDARELNPRGHFVADVRYRSAEDANADDADYAPRWLARQHDGTHLTTLLSDLVDTDDPGVARTALQQIFRTLRAVIDHDDDLDLWRGYMVDKRRYDERTDDHSADAILGAGDLGRLWKSIAAPPKNFSGPGAPNRVQLHAVGPRILDHQGVTHDTPIVDMPPRVAGLTEETAWVNTIVTAQMFLTREADIDRTDDLYVESALNRDATTIHSRVDDPWQQGGIWRTERFDPALPPPSLLTEAPWIPLSLGVHPWEDVVDAATEPDRDADGHTDGIDEVEEVLEATYDTWKMPLATSRLDAGELYVPAGVRETWDDGRPMTLRLSNLDNRTIRSVTYNAYRHTLVGIDWPPAVPVAAIITAKVAADIGTVVDVATIPLDEPVTYHIDGFGYRVEVAVDEALLRRTLSEDPSAASRRPGRARPSTLAGVVAPMIAVIAEHGSPTPDGLREMIVADIASHLFPTSGPLPRYQDLLVKAAKRAGLPVQPGVIQWDPRSGAGVNSNVTLDTLRGAGDHRAGTALDAVRSRHHVQAFLRRLKMSSEATGDRKAQYRRDRTTYGWHHLPEELPRGFTYVTDHDRGTT